MVSANRYLALILHLIFIMIDCPGRLTLEERLTLLKKRPYDHIRFPMTTDANRRRARIRGNRFGRVDYAQVLAESGNICGICQLHVDTSDRKAYHFDHIEPLALGGPHTQDNLQLAHAACNRSKGFRRTIPKN